MNFFDKTFYELDEHHQYVICFLAYCGTDVSCQCINEMLPNRNNSVFFKPDFREEVIVSRILIHPKVSTQPLESYEISGMWYVPAIKFLYTCHPEWIPCFEKQQKEHQLRSPVFKLMLRDWLSLFLTRGELSSGFIFRKANSYLYYNNLWTLAFYPNLHELFRSFPEQYLPDFLGFVVEKAFLADWVDEERSLDALLQKKISYSKVIRLELEDIIRLYDYIAFGEYDGIISCRSVYSYFLKALRNVQFNRDNDETLKLFQMALAFHNNDRHEALPFFSSSSLLNYFFFAYYSHQKVTLREKLYANVLSMKNMYETPSLWLPFIMADMSSGIKHTLSVELITKMNSLTGSYEHRLFDSLVPILSLALNIPIEFDSDTSAISPSLAILRHEFQSLMRLDDVELDRLNQCFGHPVLSNDLAAPAWKQDLDELAQICSPDEMKKEVTERSSRLCYFVKDGYVQLKEQKRKKNGGWSPGKMIDKYAYGWCDLECMDDTDYELRRINHSTHSSMNIQYFLPHLVGCDRVFVYVDGHYEPAVVEEGKPYLMVSRTENCFLLLTNVVCVPNVEEQNKFVLQKDDTHFEVFQLSDVERKLYTQVQNLQRLPLMAEERLKEVLEQVGKFTPVLSNMPGFKSSVDEVLGSAFLLLNILNEKPDVFDVEIVVQPFKESERTFVPGEGDVVYMDSDSEGKTVHVRRAPKVELSLLRMLNKEIMRIDSEDDAKRNMKKGEAKRNRWQLGLEEMLGVLSFVGEHTDEYGVAWPKGMKLSVKQADSLSEWVFDLKECAGWFEMEGKVKMDDGVMMDVASLLNRLTNDDSRQFVQLSSSEYLVLTDKLRARLEQLNALSVNDKGKFCVPFVNSLLLDEVVEDARTNGGESLKEMVSKIRDSYNLNPRVPKALNAQLREYQLEGFRWMARLNSWGAGACLADDMGLGKTVQLIALLLYKAKEGPSIVIAPTSVVSNWRNELVKFAPSLDVVLLNDYLSEERAEQVSMATKNCVVLTTYGLVNTESEMLSAKEWNVICLDEAHTIKNREAKTTQSVFDLNGKTKVALTGTPIQNHLGELWSLFNFLNPGMLGNYEDFRKKFIVPIEGGDKDCYARLRKLVLPFLLRRTKNEVVKELPGKTEIQLDVELSKEEMATYELIRKKAKERLEEEGKASVSVLAEITRLRRAACAASLVNPGLTYASTKIERLKELVDEITQGDNRILVFSQFTSFLAMAKAALDEMGVEYMYLDGQTPMKQRAEMVDKFQNGSMKLFVISLKAGGLGLNLTGANYVIHMDPWWNPVIEQQATDRAYRIGQEQHVTVYHLIASHTIEEKILRLHQTKRDLADSLLEGSNVGHRLTEEDLRELLQ